MSMPFRPAEPGATRELTSAEWQSIAGSRQVGRVVAGMIGAVFLAFAAVATYGVFADRRTHAVGSITTVLLALVFAVPGAAVLNAAYLGAAERPWRRGRRVGRLRGVVGFDAKSALPTIGSVTVMLPPAWAGQLRRDALADVEVTPPVDPSVSWLKRLAFRQVVSMDDGRLWIGDLDRPATPGAE